MQHDGNHRAVFAPDLHFEARDTARGERSDAFEVPGKMRGASGFRISGDPENLLHLRHEPQGLARRQKRQSLPIFLKFAGVISEQTLGGGVHVERLPVEIDGSNRWAGRVNHLAHGVGDHHIGFRRGLLPGHHANRENGDAESSRKNQGAVKAGAGGQASHNCGRGKDRGQAGDGRPELRDSGAMRRRFPCCSSQFHIDAVLHAPPRAHPQRRGPCPVAPILTEA